MKSFFHFFPVLYTYTNIPEKKIKKYDEWKKMMVEKIRKARKEGKEVAGLVEEVQSNQLFYWMGPQRPNYFIMPLSQA